MSKLAISLACGPYDRTEALRNGAVQLEGVELNYIAIQSPPEIFSRMVTNQAFDVSEMSCSHYLVARSKEHFPFVAVPVFPSRMFRHGYIFVNTNAGIRTARDLDGKRIGVPEYSQTAAVWIRGLLQNEYGMALDNVHWYAGGVNGPDRPGVLRLVPEGDLSLNYIGPGETLNRMLQEGDIDAIIGARIPDSLGKAPHIQRLFPNYRELEKQYFRNTGVCPIMHTLVIKESLYDQQPWLAQSLYKGFSQAKDWALSGARFSGSLRYMLPWLQDDLTEMSELFGADPWPYGIEPNRKTLETLVNYLVQQRFLAEPVSLEDAFAPIVNIGE